jgi:hypothetical protein
VYLECLFFLDHLLSLGSFPESILESAGHGLHETHASSSGSTTALCLFSPVILTHLLVGVSARRALRLLDVERSLSTSAARSVRLVVSLSEGCGSLCL